MVTSKAESILNKICNSSAFRIAYIIDLFLGSVVLLEEFSIVVKCVILTWGGIILLNNFILSNKISKIRCYKSLLLFLASCLLTTLLHANDNLLPNLLAIYHTSICFFIFYGMYVEKDNDSLDKEMLITFKILIFLNSILSIIGLAVFYFFVQINIGDYWIGIFNNRLTGLYTNCNLLALFSVISIMGCHIIFIKDKRESKGIKDFILKHLFYIISVIINFACLILSDSNASLLFLIIYFTVYIFYKIFSYKGHASLNHPFKKVIILFVVCLFVAMSAFILRGYCQDEVAELINSVHNVEEPIHDNAPINSTYIGRENYDISSGRFTLWEQAIVMFKKHPIMGIGRGNIVDYGMRYLEGGLRFSDFHNGYITIIISWGIIGFLIFFYFAINVAYKLCYSLFKGAEKPSDDIFPNLFSIIVSYCVYSLFEKTILSEITFMVVIFWMILGYAMSLSNKYDEIDNNTHD